jgi:hypothetical protein
LSHRKAELMHRPLEQRKAPNDNENNGNQGMDQDQKGTQGPDQTRPLLLTLWTSGCFADKGHEGLASREFPWLDLRRARWGLNTSTRLCIRLTLGPEPWISKKWVMSLT